MHLIIRARSTQRQWLPIQALPAGITVDWLSENETIDKTKHYDAGVDLIGEEEPDFASAFRLLFPDALLLVNSVVKTSEAWDPATIRINAWPGFIEKEIWEAARNTLHQMAAEKIAEGLGHRLVWCPDTPGLVSARVIAQVINEAFLAWEEGVSTPTEIDIAMKTGTNYPLGPFEWAERVGKERWIALLEALEKKQPRYHLAGSWKKEVKHG